jgi:TPR repeat protein
LLKRLANTGYAEANFFLGDAFADDGKDTQAYNQYLMAAKRGYAPACHAIGVCAENGRGCKKNYRLALEMYTKAASAGNLDSMYRLGLAELEGSLGLRPDIEKAVKWFKRAIAGIRRIKDLVPNKEHPEPLFELAKIYEIGYPPYISQDYAYARGVLQEAVEFNYPPAIYKLGYAYEHGLMGIEANAVLFKLI